MSGAMPADGVVPTLIHGEMDHPSPPLPLPGIAFVRPSAPGVSPRGFEMLDKSGLRKSGSASWPEMSLFDAIHEVAWSKWVFCVGWASALARGREWMLSRQLAITSSDVVGKGATSALASPADEVAIGAMVLEGMGAESAEGAGDAETEARITLPESETRRIVVAEPPSTSEDSGGTVKSV